MDDTQDGPAAPTLAGRGFERDGAEYREVAVPGADLAWTVYAGATGDILVSKGDGDLVRPRRTVNEGYEMVSLLCRDGRYAQRRVHQLVALAFIGPPPSPAHVVDHIDAVPSHNAATNLRWVTARENRANRTRHMRRPPTTRGRIRKIPVSMQAAREVQRHTGLRGQRLYRWVERAMRKSIRTEK